MSAAPQILVQPASTLMDEVVAVRVSDLQPGQPVTMVTRVQDAGNRYLGNGWYTADHQGALDMTRMESTGGSFTGAEPMGLFWSMLPELDQKPGMRLMKRDVTTPLEVELSVYDGHFDAMDIQLRATRAPLATTVIDRWYMADNVERREVRTGRLVATFFIPKEGRDHPGVLDMFGTVGGLMEHRAALLASRGFATLALQYFTPKGSFQFTFRTDLEYFEEAVDYLLNQPRVSQRGVGVIGISKGAEMALLIAAVCPKVTAVIWINGHYHNNLIDHTYHGEVFPSTNVTLEHATHSEDGLLIFRHMYDHDPEDLERTAIPVERSNAQFLLIYGEDDQSSSPDGTEYIERRLADHGKADHCQVILYPQTGHLLEPPISPICTRSYHAVFGGICLWGGEPRAQAHAQEDMWRQMQTFLRRQLEPANETDASSMDSKL